jgi:hypothetical protein
MRNMHHLASGFDSSTRRSEPHMSGTRHERRPRGFPDRIQRVDLEESAGSPVCTENLNPDVVVMKSAKDRV